jgi:hypothetical protein
MRHRMQGCTLEKKGVSIMDGHVERVKLTVVHVVTIRSRRNSQQWGEHGAVELNGI